MAILVGDANIFIDITVSNLTRMMFQLGDTIATPDVLYQEELQEYHPELPGLGLKIEQLSSEGVAEVQLSGDAYTGPSRHDLFALTLAKTNGWTLLTGDESLRLAAEAEAVEAHGTLWLVERMVVTRVINAERAETAFELMRNNDRRLPWNEVDELIVRLRG